MKNTVTLRFLLENMHFVDYTHVVARERLQSGIMCPIGGGYPDKIMKRYGDREVVRSSVVDGVLYIDLKCS